MAFWGVEVKPGKAFTHPPDKGRLHLSQATLGIGTAITKSTVQCNVGNRRPVYMCSLFPGKAESCQLNLEFEESDNVVFSVIGPRAVHLTGYYQRSVCGYSPGDESESYGEDLGETDTERSVSSDKDEYEDSFIDDDDPEVFPTSPNSPGAKTEDGTSGKRKPKNANSKYRRLRKKLQLSESDDSHSRQHASPKLFGIFDVSSSENEDALPISTLCKNSHASKSLHMNDERAKGITDEISNQEAEDKSNSVTMSEMNDLAATIQPESETGNKIDTGSEYVREGQRREARGSNSADGNPGHPLPLEAQENVKDRDNCGSKQKRTSQKVVKEKVLLEVDSNDQCKIDLKDEFQKDDAKINHRSQHPSGGEEKLEKASDEAGDVPHFFPLGTQTLSEDGEQEKRKRKRKTKEVCARDTVSTANKGLKDGPEPNLAAVDLPEYKNHNDNMANDEVCGNDADQCSLENQCVKRKRKRKKRNLETNTMDIGSPVPCVGKRDKSVDVESRNADDEVMQSRTLSNGLIIEELEMGKSDGKMATLGKKVSINYVGKLRESGREFDSNLDKAPLKFKLGAEVRGGWYAGLDGMRVGGKRRITVPPSMGLMSEGAMKNVPPNSWLVFDIELVKVR